jgi:hypothetical protein
LGRFINEDTYEGQANNPLTLNVYAYCGNNPLIYVDPSGHFWETLLDIGGIIWSTADLIKNPSWSNLGYLLWDVGATVIPFVPGSYTAKGGRLLVKGLSNTDEVIDAFKVLNKADRLGAVGNGNLIMQFKDLKKVAKGLDLEVHHSIEKRFSKTLGIDANEILSIAIDKDTHKQITKLMRQEVPYDTLFKKGTSAATPQQIWNATVNVYNELGITEYLPLLKEQLLDSATKANKITDWLGW